MSTISNRSINWQSNHCKSIYTNNIQSYAYNAIKYIQNHTSSINCLQYLKQYHLIEHGQTYA